MQDVVEFAALEGKKVVVQYTEQGEVDGEVKEAHGVLEKANELGLLFKPKGRASTLIFAEQVVGLEEDTSVPEDKIRQKRLNPVEDKAVKQHLVDRHGIALSAVNSMDETQAVSVHNQVHESDTAKEIGHFHKEKAARKEKTAD
jgi:hypothetical protein